MIIIITIIIIIIIIIIINLHPTWSTFIEYFNAKCSEWFASDKNNTSGIESNNITRTFGYNQVIDKPTHYFNESLSCIDFIDSFDVCLTKH